MRNVASVAVGVAQRPACMWWYQVGLWYWLVELTGKKHDVGSQGSYAAVFASLAATFMLQ